MIYTTVHGHGGLYYNAIYICESESAVIMMSLSRVLLGGKMEVVGVASNEGGGHSIGGDLNL